MPEKASSIHFDSIQFNSIHFNPKFLNFVRMLIFLYRNFQHKPPFCNMDLPELDYLSMLFILEYIQCSNKPTSMIITINSGIRVLVYSLPEKCASCITNIPGVPTNPTPLYLQSSPALGEPNSTSLAPFLAELAYLGLLFIWFISWRRGWLA